MAKKNDPLGNINNIIAVGIGAHPTEIREKMVAIYRKMLKEGMHNGAQGIVVNEDTIIKRTREQAETCKDELATLIKQRLGQLEQEKKSKEIQYQHSSEDLKTMYHDLGYLNMIRNHAMDHQGNLSLWICVVLGIFLLIADIALALQLVQLGFSFPKPANKNYQLGNLMSHNFFNVLQQNWQVFLTAFGIAIFTIMLKIGFDRFIGPSYGAGYIRRVRFIRWFKKVEDTNTDNQDKLLRKIRRYERVKQTVILFFVALTIGFLVLLAQFRSLSEVKARIDKVNEQKVEALDNQINDLEFEVFNSRKNKLDEEIKDSVEGHEKDANHIYRVTFLGITLLFPVISAICLSIAGAAWDTRRKIKKLSQEIETGIIKLDEDQQQYGKVVGKFDAWTLEQENIDGPDWIKNVSGKLNDLYHYGFRIGNIRPDLFQNIPDMYTIIEKYRDKRILYFTNQKLIKLNSPNHGNNPV
ncbi:MAG: hypothetical protein P0Y53_20890 [Candidatus Pseudobacter hemicellulosilyticus]|uniref:Uncharacterized protein n=1 Tax=Candidatus Pseudobacter hemicellulosilyticus TaxID=3121375 RepID=A0AAJ6BFB6_9BACT|nr:MAG: hypothetical protein P0Y53_20890 [Pseudobacter sp.]